MSGNIAAETMTKLLKWGPFLKTEGEVQGFINIYSHLKYEAFVYAKVYVSDFKAIQFPAAGLVTGIS